MDRRAFFNLVGVAGVASVAGEGQARASESQADAEDTVGILADLTACIGCRTCEQACASFHDLPEPEDIDTPLMELPKRKTSESCWTVVNGYETSRGQVCVKRQCMHCVTPACSAACLTKALVKTKEGPVVWDESKCMGCRYCMISCPFDVPKFEFDSPTPRIQKCRMWWERLQEGEVPACVDFCGGDALTFGKRNELLEIARQRIYQNPDKYVSHIYGEREVGGTGFLYISPVPFEELDFPTDLGETAFPEYTRGFLGAVPLVLTVWPAFLFGLHQAMRPAENKTSEPDEHPDTEA